MSSSPSSRTARSSCASRSRSTSPARSAARTATSRFAPASRSRTSRSARAATVYRPGANTELGGFGLPDSFGVTDIDDGLRIVWHYAGDRPAAHVHDLVPVPRARRRLRRRRRREPARVGRALAGRAREPDGGDAAPAPDQALALVPRLGKPRLGARRRRAGSRPGDAAGGPGSHAPVRRAPCALPAKPAHVDRGRAGPARERARQDRRGGARRAARLRARPGEDRRRERAPGSDAPPPAPARPGARTGADGARLALLRPRAADGLRPRVRAGAADRHGAGARPVAREAGDRAGLERVHGDALRPHPAGPLQGDAGHDRALRLGRASPPGRRRPARHPWGRDGGDGAVRGARDAGRRFGRRRRRRAALGVPRGDRGRPGGEQQALQVLQGPGDARRSRSAAGS